jgi:nucleotide-binding universal stress UspA family protein
MTQHDAGQQESPRPHLERAQPIVVGVDGSPSSVRALRWAVGQAGLVEAPVEAVIAWQDPAIYGMGFDWAPVSYDSDRLAAAAEKVLADSLAQVTAGHQTKGSPAQLVPRVVQGHPAQVLLEAARGAQLLVVGSRGHGTLAGMLLGSVSQHCVQHAPCPVLVVPAAPHPSPTPAPGSAG